MTASVSSARSCVQKCTVTRSAAVPAACSYVSQIAFDLKSLQTDDKVLCQAEDKVLCWDNIWVYTKSCKRTIKYSADGSGLEEHAVQGLPDGRLEGEEGSHQHAVQGTRDRDPS